MEVRYETALRIYLKLLDRMDRRAHREIAEQSFRMAEELIKRSEKEADGYGQARETKK